jgi:hypothetical protein
VHDDATIDPVDPTQPGLARILAELNPDEFALRAAVVPQLDASMLDEIAAADYGMDIDRNREALDDLLTSRRWPPDLDWQPMEVLQLTRSLRPDRSDLNAGATGRRGHLMRILACLVLVRVRTANGFPADSVAPLVESALELGSPMAGEALRFLAWCRLHEPGDWADEPAARPFLTFGVLLLATATGVDPGHLGRLADAFLGELEQALEDEGLGWQIHVGPPLLGLKPQQRRRWRALAGRCLADHAPASVPDTELGRALELLGTAIRDKSDVSTSDIRALLVRWRQ